MISLTLPYPPSANHLWRAVKGRMIKTAVYRSWLSDAALALQRPSPRLGEHTDEVKREIGYSSPHPSAK